MRRIILLSRPAEGGIRSHLISLLRHLDRTKYEVTLAGPSQLLETMPLDLPSFERFVVPIDGNLTWNDLPAVARTVRITRKDRPLVHAHGVRAGFIAALARSFSSFPLVITYHNSPEPSLLPRTAVRLINSRANESIAVSNSVAKLLPTPKAVVIPNGIDLNYFSNLDRSKYRHDLQIEETQIVVACVARLSPEKGVDILIEAARLQPNTLFLIAGGGPEGARIEASAPTNVRFLGYVADVRTVLGAADIAAIPSRSEGQGIVALEAMACGLPVIASAVGGLVEMIKNDINGLLLQPDNPHQLASCIEQLSRDTTRRSRLGNAAKTWVDAHGDVESQVRETELVYDSVLGEN